jgi:DNA-binding transcriptional LysR family regulator
MNVHHLELFYYVARHGGISEAARQMPYGIQQPAISGQIIQLEEFIGVTLFHRRPFALTPAGEQLYAFVQPFFDNLGSMADRLRGGMAQHIRIAASEIVMRDYLPAILQELGRQFPKLKVTLKEGYHPQTLTWFQNQQIDVTIGLLGGKPGHGLSALPMFHLPLVLLVPKSSRLKSAAELWKQDRISETLITVPSNEPICRALQEGLAERKVDWFSGIEVSTVDLVQTYVANGYGYGVTVGIPKAKLHPEVRVVPLKGFPLTTFGVLWQGRKTPVLEALVDLVQAAVRHIMDGEDDTLMLLKDGP